MKIGVLTLPLHTNIGGILQAYALQTVLENLGHSVSMLFPEKTMREKVTHVVRNVLNAMKSFPQDKIDSDKFIRDKFSSWFLFKEGLDEKMKIFDAVVVGSDQVWRSFGEKWNIHQYFFDFVQDLHVKKYSYAASLGIDDWMFSNQDTAQIKSLVKKFVKISVREKEGVALCKKYLDMDAEWLLDPTMLLEKKDYENLVQCESKGNLGLVCYYIGENEKNNLFLKETLNTTASFFGNKWTMAKKQDDIASNSNNLLPTIENWLYNMMNASFVITNSFHGVAFSINFEKPFIVLSHSSGGNSRINSILSMFGLENRLVSDVSDILKIVNKKIDWNRVSNIKELKRKQSVEFLKSI